MVRISFFIKLPAVILLGLFFGCEGERPQAGEPVRVDTTLWRDGDLLFRMGLEGASRVVTTVGGGDFSHVGLTLKKNGRGGARGAQRSTAGRDRPHQVRASGQFLCTAESLSGSMAKSRLFR